jgi:hypothetical protein
VRGVCASALPIAVNATCCTRRRPGRFGRQATADEACKTALRSPQSVRAAELCGRDSWVAARGTRRFRTVVSRPCSPSAGGLPVRRGRDPERGQLIGRVRGPRIRAPHCGHVHARRWQHFPGRSSQVAIQPDSAGITCTCRTDRRHRLADRGDPAAQGPQRPRDAAPVAAQRPEPRR